MNMERSVEWWILDPVEEDSRLCKESRCLRGKRGISRKDRGGRLNIIYIYIYI